MNRPLEGALPLHNSAERPLRVRWAPDVPPVCVAARIASPINPYSVSVGRPLGARRHLSASLGLSVSGRVFFCLSFLLTQLLGASLSPAQKYACVAARRRAWLPLRFPSLRAILAR